MLIVNITTAKTTMSVEIKKKLSNKDKNNEPND